MSNTPYNYAEELLSLSEDIANRYFPSKIEAFFARNETRLTALFPYREKLKKYIIDLWYSNNDEQIDKVLCTFGHMLQQDVNLRGEINNFGEYIDNEIDSHSGDKPNPNPIHIHLTAKTILEGPTTIDYLWFSTKNGEVIVDCTTITSNTTIGGVFNAELSAGYFNGEHADGKIDLLDGAKLTKIELYNPSRVDDNGVYGSDVFTVNKLQIFDKNICNLIYKFENPYEVVFSSQD